MNPQGKYKPFPAIKLSARQWPSKIIEKAPIWCSVDLRDGNQALVEPMGLERKLYMFDHLVKLGFKEIEVGFPSASETDYQFLRHLIENELIPSDVTIQVLTQARASLIRRSFEGLKGAKRAILHLYNSTSTVQRRVVFMQDKAGITKIATNATELVKECAYQAEEEGTKIQLQYSPESFTGTELDFALNVCHAVLDIWQPSKTNKVIINLPATVEMSTPNIYADQVEWMHRHLQDRDKITLSLHPHNDRGTAVAAAELGMMAGADRIEGTLFGNGERTGNVDIVTLALNLYSQGHDPKLDFSQIKESIKLAEYCTQLPVHPRHPYAGDLVYTAFSGSHQDAIKKGMDARNTSNSGEWEIPYLPIDPQDVGRNYEAIIRVNSQSGKGGVAWLLQQEYGLKLPRSLQIAMSALVQKRTDETGEEISAEEIHSIFKQNFVNLNPIILLESYDLEMHQSDTAEVTCQAQLNWGGKKILLQGAGNGPINAFVQALRSHEEMPVFHFEEYEQHAIGHGSAVQAICYVEITSAQAQTWHGVGIDENTGSASFLAILSAVNRLLTYS